MNVKKHLSIRMDGELHDKFQYVAAYEGRSMSGQVLYLLRKCVQEHEKEYGKITKEDLAARRFDRIWLILQCY